MSVNGIQILRYCDLVCRIELAAFDEHALALTEINRALLEALQPGMAVTVGKVEEEPFDLHVAASCEQLLQAARAEIGHALHQLVDLMKAFASRQFVH